MLALSQMWQQLLADGTLQIAKFDGGFYDDLVNGFYLN